MGNIAIHIEGLGKQYRLGARKVPYKALRDVLSDAFNSLWQHLSSSPNEGENGAGNRSNGKFWALKGISFDVRKGEVLGIIGRNGVGKSTLLKVLSRIAEPTEGYAELSGCVSSLLEVGTGFHPELTGRENIYLNSAILGMKRAEINKKFDEIVSFAEVEKFIDAPVKHYSSGMYMRLAFSVAAHLEPDILLIDEVLAVGDAAFQKKCLGKMGKIAQGGRTVLFVSHNMSAIGTLTERSIWLDGGTLKMDGLSDQVVSAYLSATYRKENVWRAAIFHAKPMQILEVRIISTGSADVEGDFNVSKGLRVEVDYSVRRVVRGAVVSVNIHAVDGAHLLSMEDSDRNPELLLKRSPGNYTASVAIPGGWLNSGSYLLRVGCGMPRIESFENIEALSFDLIETGDPNTRGHRRGYLLPMLEWKTQPLGLSADGRIK
jgi:lipopolysaccharide transport system ATP-binding protein